MDDKNEAVFNAWMNYVKRKKVDKTADKNLDDDADEQHAANN